MKKIVSMLLSLMMICSSVIVFADETSSTDNCALPEKIDSKKLQKTE